MKDDIKKSLALAKQRRQQQDLAAWKQVDITDFADLETTRRMGIEAAHRTIAALNALTYLNEEQSKQLQILMKVVTEAEELDMKKFEFAQKYGGTEPAKEPESKP